MTLITRSISDVTSKPAWSKRNFIPVLHSLSKLLFASLILAPAWLSIVAQDIHVHITVDEARPGIAVVEGHSAKAWAVLNLSFLQSYAGVANLGDRISNVKLADVDKNEDGFKRLQAGEYLAERNFAWFRYDVDLRATRGTNAAHVSWLTADGGMLALDDLLPQPTDKRVRLTLDLPRFWRMISNEDHVYENVFDIHDAQRAVVFVGKNWRIKPVGATQLTLAVAGEHQIPDPTIANDAAEIYKTYFAMFGAAPTAPAAQIAISNFPTAFSPGVWEAETRGSTVTILTSGGLSPADAEQRLDQQLRHELFHLWLPNGVNLSGNYDWFYEGFAVYEEQKLGVAMDQIRFADLLGTLGRAYDIDRFSARRSLVEASQNRWAGASSQVYARGMLVAFLCDVALLDTSKGKTSVESLLRQIFDEHKPPAAAVNGNDAVMAATRTHPELAAVVDEYVTGSNAIDWIPALQKCGIRATTRDQLTELSVSDKLNGRQKALLDKLGYNNWRKLAPK
jgi:hypothetical protein